MAALWIGVHLAGEVSAAGFDERGKLDLSEADWSYGFENLPQEEDGFLLFNHYLASARQDILMRNEQGLEGQGALRVGGDRAGAHLFLDQAWQQFEGRRVEVTFWTKAQGTEIQASLSWISGDLLDSFQTRSSYVYLAIIKFRPTGQATSDGWVEMTSGPLDYNMAGIAPDALSLNDIQHRGGRVGQGYPYDERARVLIDALEVHDLGPALVDGTARCDGANEALACGAGGACLMGRCVDAAHVYGQPLQGQVHQDYIARRLFELEAFSGPRAGRANLPQVRTLLEGLDGKNAFEYWEGFSKAHELMIDGHGRPPSDRQFSFTNSSGVCFGPGLADLASDPSARAEMLPMVFSADATFTVGAELQRGDVLTQIDGLDPWEWVARHPVMFYYGGDGEGRKINALQSLMNAAQHVGSRLTFERCARTDNQPCEASQRVEIEVDLATLFGDAIYAQQPFGEFYERSNPCDLRFKRGVALPAESDNQYHTAGWADRDGVRHLLINGVPDNDDQAGSNWHTTVDSALISGADRVMLDQRVGYGGTMNGVARVIGHLLDPSNRVTTLFVPWFGEVIQGALYDAFMQCYQEVERASRCGSFFGVTVTDLVNSGGSRSSRLAVLNGYDVSGNDYLSRFLLYRQAPTRIFGYGPTVGAYGASCSFAPLIWETGSMRYQCHDSQFSASDQGPFGSFESGMGVEPDETIYQRQSDATADVDTLMEAAKAWLNSDQQDEEVTP